MHTWHEKKVWQLVGFVVSVFLCVCFVGFGFVCSFLVWSEGLFLFFKSFHIKRRAWCEIQTWSKIGLLCLRGLEGSIFIYLEYISVSGVEKLFFLSGSTLVNSGIRGSRVNKYHWHHLFWFSWIFEFLITSVLPKPSLMCSSTKNISVAAYQHAKLYLSCIPVWNAQSNLQPFACKTFYLQNQKVFMALTSMPMQLHGYPKNKINLQKKCTSKTIT